MLTCFAFFVFLFIYFSTICTISIISLNINIKLIGNDCESVRSASHCSRSIAAIGPCLFRSHNPGVRCYESDTESAASKVMADGVEDGEEGSGVSARSGGSGPGHANQCC